LAGREGGLEGIWTPDRLVSLL